MPRHRWVVMGAALLWAALGAQEQARAAEPTPPLQGAIHDGVAARPARSDEAAPRASGSAANPKDAAHKAKVRGPVYPEGCVGFRQTGGIAGLDVWFYIDAHGQVFRRVRTSPAVRVERTLSPAVLAELRKEMREAGFFTWPERSERPGISDAMSYTIFYDDGKQRHQVQVGTGAVEPKGFPALLKHLRSLTQP